MRRIVAAVVTTVLITVTAASPAMAAPEQSQVGEISCGTIGDPICPVIEQMKALLAPLEAVSAVTAPLLGELGGGLTLLTTLFESSPIPADQLAQAAGDALDRLRVAAQPVLTLLASLGIPVDLLTSTLGQLEALARQGMEAVTQQLGVTGSPTTEPAPAPVPAPSAPTTRSASSGGAAPAQLGAPAAPPTGPSLTTGGPGSRRLTFPGLPAGSSLKLSPLGLPRFSPSAPATATADRATTDRAAVDAAAAKVVMPAVRAASVPSSSDDGRTGSVAVAVAALLLAVGLMIDQTRKVREPLEV